MTPEELERRLKLGEDSVTEFKSVLLNPRQQVDPRDIAKALASLANTRGGLLVLGVEDDGAVTGVGTPKDLDNLMIQVSQVCHSRLQPALACTQKKLEVQGQYVLVVEVPAFNPDRPHHVDGKYYVRDANQSREARREELSRLFQSSNTPHFDEQPVEGSTLKDLDEGAIREFLKSLYEYDDLEIDDQQVRLLQTLQCVDRNGVPTVTGILLLGREPQRWLRDARISAVVLPGRELGSDFIDRQELDGRLPEQIQAAATFLKRNVRAPSHVEGLERVEEGIPEKVLREAVLNAVTHRDYRIASQVRIFVFEDRVEIVNPGELLNQLTLEGIQVGGISQRRNPVLAGLLVSLRRRENLGMGVPEMIRLMRQRKLPAPVFTVASGHFKVALRLKQEARYG